ncbi:MAG: peptidoglycan DD-metalloendopeptidase family protein [Methylococcaceae bacterium]|jgi:lipoprotein NlpD
MDSLNLILVFLGIMLLASCTHDKNYAPVMAHSKDSPALVETVPSAPVLKSPPNIKVANNTKNNTIPAETRYYVVKTGDTLYSLGQRTGLSVENLVKWNQLKPPFYVKLRQKLKLFDPKSAAIGAENKKNPLPNVKNLEIVDNKRSTISNINKKMLKLNWQWPIKGKVIKNFSQSGKGIDIKGKLGQQVMAAEAGKVVYGGKGLIGYGSLVIIQHNEEYLSAYANNSTLLISEGQSIEKGQAIAEIGNAGAKRATLHFEIRKHGKSVNPLKFLPKKQ